ncbi:YqcI/YcgG family protein [Bacillus cereus]|uniref:YqcI/YcgG family protein n=1 Tax=Bacillus cereus TaxID=1396 RepID=UPI000BFB29AD|nr:YqcI/YcgG family protein [Bacillus cereus]PGR70381.1 hypothetical protein COC49_00520 [Bacillus cereus]
MFEKDQILNFNENDWRKKSFSSFSQDLTGTNPKFPCVFGTNGFKANQLRFAFFEGLNDDSLNELSESLDEYVKKARGFGSYTSFVAFFNINKEKSMNEYESDFWYVLNKLNELDQHEWPEEIPQDTNNPEWEFSFAGEPIFVVCNTPSHQLRQSRYAETFMITFQPRWVFDEIGLLTPKGKKQKELVRKLLNIYDSIEEYPYLGTYGDLDNKEWLQYFIPDTNTVNIKGCPFHRKDNSMQKVEYIQGLNISLEDAVMELLPETGSVEVQRDTPRREHKTHTHPTDETLLIIEGEITFYANGESVKCNSGDRILLPAGTEHSSIAGENGCLYIIALEFIASNKLSNKEGALV